MADASVGIRKDPNYGPNPEQIFKHQSSELIRYKKSMSMHMLGERLEKPKHPRGKSAPKDD
jgi:hypothetical protein